MIWGKKETKPKDIILRGRRSYYGVSVFGLIEIALAIRYDNMRGRTPRSGSGGRDK